MAALYHLLYQMAQQVKSIGGHVFILGECTMLKWHHGVNPKNDRCFTKLLLRVTIDSCT